MPVDPLLVPVIQGFVAEASELAQQVTRDLLTLERGGGEARAGEYDRLARNLHTLKGSAGTLGLDDLSTLAHRLEEVVLPICRARAPLPASVPDQLLRGLDLFLERLRVHAAGKNEPLPALEPQLANLLQNAAGAIEPEPVRAPEPEPASELGEDGWRIRGAQIGALTSEIDRLRELRMRLEDRRRELDGAIAELGRAELGSAEANARARLETVSRSLGAEGAEAGAIIEALEEELRSICTLPIRVLIDPLHRAVRDLCRASGKEARLSVVGGDVAIDRRVLEGLRSVLMHLVRNAVDHGIEAPGARAARGKHREGAIVIRVEQQGNLLRLEVSDDGNGLDEARIRQVALERGLLSAQELERANEAEIRRLIFRSGLSTREEVSETSGRGVGLDAVASLVQALQGSIDVASAPAQGTRFTVTAPIELGASPVMVVRVGEVLLGVSILAIEGVVVGHRAAIRGTTDTPRLVHRDQLLAVRDLGALLGVRPALPELEGVPILILQALGRRTAIVVDEVLGDRELVVRPLPEALRGLPCYQGASTLARGELLLVLRPEWLDQGEGAPSVAAGRRVLVVDDSLTARAMHRALLEAGGYLVQAVSSGAKALEQVGLFRYDAIVCDVAMEGMDGLELTRRLRNNALTRALPVVLVSAHGGDELAGQGLAAGADAFVSKQDCGAGKLLERLEAVLARRARA